MPDGTSDDATPRRRTTSPNAAPQISALNRLEQVVRLVGELHVGVAGDAERRRARGSPSRGRGTVEVVSDHVLDRDDQRPASPTETKRGSSSGTLTRANRSSPVSGSRASTPRLRRRAARCTGTAGRGRRRAASAPGRSRARTAGSSSARSSLVAVLHAADLDALRRERRRELLPPEASTARRSARSTRSRIARERLARRQPVVASAPTAPDARLVHQPGHAHHEELVQVRREESSRSSRARAAGSSASRGQLEHAAR